jgi:hypothetical protein
LDEPTTLNPTAKTPEIGDIHDDRSPRGGATLAHGRNHLTVPSKQTTGEESMAWKGIVGRSFTPDQFATYVAGLKFNAWRPRFVVVHNTSAP